MSLTGARIVSIALLIASCGAVVPDEGQDAAPPIDPPRACPAGTTGIDEAACIETIERGTAPWEVARDTCAGEGRRLCTDAEWVLACETLAGLANMANDDGGTALEWEWVAEVDDDFAMRRGYETCADQAPTAVFDPYDYRCCVDR